ncbi:MAG: radical SAM protein [Oligoflexales bacterium]|nr:radical SAM protein [Oligoflexales bacterium]
MAEILLLTPPMTQLNTPYPATAYLSGFLKSKGKDVAQADPALELIYAAFSSSGLSDILKNISKQKIPRSKKYSIHFILHQDRYLTTADAVLEFLSGKDPTLARRIVTRNFLPEGPSFQTLEQWSETDDPNIEWAFGQLGLNDRAKYYASLYLDDLAGVISESIDPLFNLSRYGEKLAASVESFTPIENAINAEESLLATYLKTITHKHLKTHSPKILGLSVPFPGNLLGALMIAKFTKEYDANIKIILGGGYVNTELRGLSEPRIFNYIDFITLDDGEMPLLSILEFLDGKRTQDQLFRCFIRSEQQVKFITNTKDKDVHHNEVGTPTYAGLKLDNYLSIFEMLNPMHRIWSDGRWNKLTLAHGCYWSRCSFCDVSLDYIQRYQEADIGTLLQRIKTLISETGQSGFHFVDEAAPPKILFALAKAIEAEKINVTWWGNIRFEKSFNNKTIAALANSGCVAVTGGLEVASDRLLKLMDKGVTVEQVAKVTKSFSQHGILVHAYLMYGFPSQTMQETIDSLERVRQLFLHNCIQSAFWHRFSVTHHSPIGKNPEKYGLTLKAPAKNAFAINDIEFVDTVVCDHDFLGRGLNKALYNYMLGLGLDEPLKIWFDGPIPKTSIPKNLIASYLLEDES